MPARAVETARRPRRMAANGLTGLSSTLGRLEYAGDGGADPAARGERPGHLAAARGTGPDEVVEQPVGDRLVEDSLVAECLEKELQRLQFDAQPVRGVPEGDGSEVRVAGLRTHAGKLRADDL